ncbi:MAG: site-specific integrase [Clostridia bacterium]|nr:site-specific integrase [Clostridia bacterium]
MAKRKYGEGSVFLRKDGRWEGRIIIGYNENGNPKTKNVTAKTQAECKEKLQALKEKWGRTSDRLKSDMPFGDWMDFWYQNFSKPKIRQTTQECYENRIYNHIIPEIGKIPMNKLTQNDLQQFYARLKKGGRRRLTEFYGEGLSDRMVRSCHTTCRTALEKAVTEGLITVNPAIGCRLPPKKAKEMQVLTQDEIRRFLIQANEEGYYEFFLLELITGMRRGEILGLQWKDVNFATGELHIRRQVVKKGAQTQITKPKTKSSIRTILLPSDMLDILAEHKKNATCEWVFPSPVKEGEPRNPDSIYGKFQKILKRAQCKKVRFHDLRHTFATMALENGMDIKTLSAMIGHISAETTLNIYSHITDTMQQQAAVRIDREIGGTNAEMPEPKPPKASEPTPTKATPEKEFEPYKGKIRRSGTGCVTMINDHLYEGRFTPRVDGKRISKNVYAKTREECEEKLAVLIVEMKAEIKAEKERRKQAVSV